MHTEVEQFMKIEMTQLSIPIGFNYTFMANRFSPSVSIGALTTIKLEKSNRWDNYASKLYGDYAVYHSYGTAIKEMKNQSGYWFGCGLVLPVSKRISCSADMRYDLSKELSDTPIYCDINNLWISFGIHFRTR